MAAVLMIAVTACDKAEKAEKAQENTDLGAATELTTLIGSATKTLGSITDVESAKVALPALQGVGEIVGPVLDSLQGKFKSLM